ncbi:DNA damage-regulated autophagy modulator protein 1-like [Rhinoderma darwinii]|uniref:DNA damage-regulated autophagy modulator protein 1-like n=1 Tax=Rhinoderma darwinii TaxID=43563 RepID=UPI003F661E3B
MFEGHYKTPLMSISDTGAKIPESIVLTIVNTISNLLKVAIMYVMYRLIEIRAAERQICGVIFRKLLLALGWTACVGNLVAIYLQKSCVRDYIGLAALICTGLYSICLAGPLYTASRNVRCVRCTKAALSILMFLAFMSRLACKTAIYAICTSDHCIQSSKTALMILEWLVLFGSCVGNILLYRDFQVLTIRFRKSLKEDWIILRDDLEETSPSNEEKEQDPEKMGP